MAGINPRGQNYTHIFIHSPGSSGGRLGFGIVIKDAGAGALDRTTDCRVCISATRPSGRPALIAVQISYESAACGTAALGCVARLSGTSGVDRLWLPYKAALPEAADKCQAVCERRMCSRVGGNGAHVDRKAGTHRCPDKNVLSKDIWLLQMLLLYVFLQNNWNRLEQDWQLFSQYELNSGHLFICPVLACHLYWSIYVGL